MTINKHWLKLKKFMDTIHHKKANKSLEIKELKNNFKKIWLDLIKLLFLPILKNAPFIKFEMFFISEI